MEHKAGLYVQQNVKNELKENLVEWNHNSILGTSAKLSMGQIKQLTLMLWTKNRWLLEPTTLQLVSSGQETFLTGICSSQIDYCALISSQWPLGAHLAANKTRHRKMTLGVSPTRVLALGPRNHLWNLNSNY